MAILPEVSNFDSVYQIEPTDPVLGGLTGVTNTPLKNLTNRTRFLRDTTDGFILTKADIISPAFTGVPTAPTAAINTNTAQLATTAFVNAEILSDATPISHAGATGGAHGVATGVVAGFMSPVDKLAHDDAYANFQHGQCRLILDGANLRLSPLNGNRLIINGAVQSIPPGGITLSPAGLTPGVTYFIYAFMTGPTLTLESSITGHSTDTLTGVEIKTGDSTRTLVGLARVGSGPSWVNTEAQRFVISWFNRRTISGSVSMASTATTTSLSPVVLSADYAEFLTWNDEVVQGDWVGNVASTNSSVQAMIQLGIDGAVSTPGTLSGSLGLASTTVVASTKRTLSEGYHYACFIGWVVTASTGQYEVTAARSETMFVTIQG